MLSASNSEQNMYSFKFLNHLSQREWNGGKKINLTPLSLCYFATLMLHVFLNDLSSPSLLQFYFYYRIVTHHTFHTFAQTKNMRELVIFETYFKFVGEKLNNNAV